jgi:hypothetical protein
MRAFGLFFMDETIFSKELDLTALLVLHRFRRMRLRDKTLFLIPIIVALGLAYLRFTSPPPSISISGYGKILGGMSEPEAEAIVSARPGGYVCFSGPGKMLAEDWGIAIRWSRWGNRYGVLSIGFDADDRVCAKRLEYDPTRVPEQPELWPWWKRMVNRSRPETEPIVFIWMQ